MCDRPQNLRWRRHPDTAFVDFRGRIIALPLSIEPVGSPFAMQSTAAATWRILGGEPKEFSTIVADLAAMYAATPEVIGHDLARLLADLEARHLVQSLREQT